jgi:hypothetical protein
VRARRERAAQRKLGYLGALRSQYAEEQEDILRRLMDIALHGDDSDALRAIAQIENRLFGRPKETVEHQTATSQTLEELKQLPGPERARLLAEIETRNGGSLLRIVRPPKTEEAHDP